jgi:hypothetical protein
MTQRRFPDEVLGPAAKPHFVDEKMRLITVRRRGKKPYSAARGGLGCKNWRAATMSAYPPSAARRGRYDG